MASLYHVAAQLGYSEVTEDGPTRGSPLDLLESLEASIVQYDKPVEGVRNVWHGGQPRRLFGELTSLNLSQAYLQVGEGDRFLGLEFLRERETRWPVWPKDWQRIEGLLTQAFEMLLQLPSQRAKRGLQQSPSRRSVTPGRIEPQCPRVQHLKIMGPAPPSAQLRVTAESTAHSGTAYHVPHIPRDKTSPPFVAPSNQKLLDEVNIWIRPKVKERPPGTILFHKLDLRLPKVEVVMSDTREIASVQRCRLNAKYMIRVLTLPNYHFMFVRLCGNGQARRFQGWYGRELGFTEDIIASESGLDSRGDNVSGPVSARKRKRTAVVECSGSSSDSSLTNLSSSDEESDEDDQEKDVIPRTRRKETASDKFSWKGDDQLLSRPRRSIRTKKKTGIDYRDVLNNPDGPDPAEQDRDPKQDNVAPRDFTRLGRSCVLQVPDLRRAMSIRESSPGKHPGNPLQIQAQSQIYRQRPIPVKRSSSPEMKHAPSPEVEEISVLVDTHFLA